MQSEFSGLKAMRVGRNLRHFEPPKRHKWLVKVCLLKTNLKEIWDLKLGMIGGATAAVSGKSSFLGLWEASNVSGPTGCFQSLCRLANPPTWFGLGICRDRALKRWRPWCRTPIGKCDDRLLARSGSCWHCRVLK